MILSGGGGGGEITSVREGLVAVVIVSLTCTVTLYVPAKGAFAVSDAPDTDSHGAGGLTETSDQVYEFVPPVAVSPAVYVTPCIPPGRLAVVTCNCGLIVTVIVPTAVFGTVALSFTATGNIKVPDAPGVPLMVPSELRARPLGGVPMVHTYGGVPPLTTVCEYCGF